MTNTMKFKKGQLIKTYIKGYFIVEEVKGITLYSRKVMSENFKKLSGTYSCDKAWCRLVTKEELEDTVKKVSDGVDFLKDFLE